MNEIIPHLTIGTLENGNLRLENESMGDSYVVDVHPMHLRLMAEKLGLVREMSTTEADALRQVDKLARRLKLLAKRIDRLDEYLLNSSDHDHADLEWEVQYSRATCDLADEFVREIDESGTVVTPMSRETRGQVVAAKPSGNPEKTQRVSESAQLDFTA